MAESTVIRTLQDILIVITDGAGQTYTVAYEPGDLSMDFGLFGVENFLDRGRFPTTPSIRRGDDVGTSFSFTVNERDWGSASDHATPLDLAVVFAATHYVRTNYTSTIGTASDVDLYTFTVNVTQEGSEFGESDLTLALAFCTIRASRSDGYPNTISISGQSWQLRPTLS